MITPFLETADDLSQLQLIDAEALKRALKKCDFKKELVRVRTGSEALELLRGQGDKTIESPYIIFLDINMPRMNGHEFLTEMRADSALKRNVVFILSSSTMEKDLSLAYDKNVAGFFRKPNSFAGFKEFIDFVLRYSATNNFPPGAVAPLAE